MSGEVSADEIADDYRYSLESLQSPDRYAINNLTVIAKENTEHADAISNVLVDHIKKAPPHHKLPALYVLDSIAKNIGSPYTLFLGHKLYSTFMGAYSSIDASTRRKMDEMLKTWKSPVPGAISPRPVFDPQITKRIENALIQARTVALKHEQNNPLAYSHKRPGSAVGMPQWRSTPTPPQAGMQYGGYVAPAQPQLVQQAPPPAYTHTTMPGYTNSPAPNQMYSQPGMQSPYPGYQPPPHQGPPAPNYSYQQYQSTPSHIAPYQPPQATLGPDLGLLNRDIDQLIKNCQQDFSANAQNPQKMSKLQALLALQRVINSQQLPVDQMMSVRRQVDDLQVAERREQAERAAYQPPAHVPAPQPPAHVPAPQPPAPTPLQALLSQVNKPPVPPPSTAPPDTRQQQGAVQPSFTPAAPDLASLLATVGRAAPPPVPPPASATPNQNFVTPIMPPSNNYSSLLASLTQSGVSGNVASHPAAPSVPAAAPPPAAVGGSSLAALLAMASSKAPAVPANMVELSSASLKVYRPTLIKALFTRRPNQCVTCGRRFPPGPDGKVQKDKHMDWHFRTNHRIQDASKGIQNRSWYIGELEWTKAKDLNEEGTDASGTAEAPTAGANGLAAIKESYISVPSDPESHQPCPICQEPFETGFNQEIQDWVWLDATKVGNKIFHASCFADMRRGGSEAKERTATPDSVLGKRKAELPVNDPSPAKRLASS